MDKSVLNGESNFPLKLRGFEANTAQDVFVLTIVLDVNLELSLAADGYIQRTNIVLTDGQIVDGWVKI